jgi:hypothetical protein
MNFDNLDFLIYSSHKTSTQSLVKTFNNNSYSTIHCHKLDNFNLEYGKKIKNNVIITYDTFIQGLINYKNSKNKKLKIISVIRNPNDRLLSSFFQTYYSAEINVFNKRKEETTVYIKNEDELCIFYEEQVKNKILPGRNESLDEISKILGIDIIEKLEKREDYYYFNDNLFELFVLDFNKIIDSNAIDYLNKILGTNLIKSYTDNLSSEKYYFDKYKNVKKILGTKLNDVVEKQYKQFYFTAF